MDNNASSSLPTSAGTFPADDVVTLDIETSAKVEAWIRQEFDKLGSVEPEKLCEKLTEQLKTFNVPGYETYIFYEVSFARLSLNSVFDLKRPEFLRLCLKRYIVPFEVDHYFEFQYVAFVEGTKLVVPYVAPQPAVETPQGDVGITSQAVVDSFERTFEDKPLLGKSFLFYLSRHYAIEALLKNVTGLKYYAPFMAANQSSGSGKSRLLHEISEWVLPVIISGPNLTGFPKGSSLLQQFVNTMVSNANDALKSKSKKLHMHSLMTASHSFLVRTVYHAISSRWNSHLKGSTDDGNTLILDGEFFHSVVNADDATGGNPLAGIDEYLKRSDNKKPPTINLERPRETKYEPITGGDVSVEALINLLEKIRLARVPYLANMLGQDKEVVDIKLKSLPHIILVFDEAQHLSEKLTSNVKMTVTDGNSLFFTDPFKIIRRTTRNSNFYWEYAWAITLSTNSSMSNFSPTREDDPSVRKLKDITIIPPFIYEGTFDIFAHENYRKIWLPVEGEPPVVPPNAMEYSYSWKRVQHILSCGRPLFYSIVEAELGSKMFEGLENIEEWPMEVRRAFDELIDMIGMKMNGGNAGDLITGKEKDKSLLFALFAGSVGMYSFPEVLLDREDMIRRRMSWVVSYNTETKDCEIAYPSEGIFNCVLSLLLDQNLEELLANFKHDDIFAFFSKPGFKKQFSYWQVTEVLSRLVLMLAYHRTLPVTHVVSSTESMFKKMIISLDSSDLFQLLKPRLVKQLLSQFALDKEDKAEVEKFFTALGTEYDGALTTFGYFQEVREVGKPLEFVKSMLFRGSAKYFSNMRQSGADAVLPLIMQDGSCGVCLVQIKGVEKDILSKGKWPKEDADIEAATSAGISKDFYPNAFIKEHMKLCTIEGVFGKAAKEANKKRKPKGNPVPLVFNIKHSIRLIINLKSSVEAEKPRIRYYKDFEGPVLAIQTDGKLPFLLGNESTFVKNALSLKERDWEGNLPRFEAHLLSPPAADGNRDPYNPAFFGFFRDNDKSIVKSRKAIESILANRPRDFYP